MFYFYWQSHISKLKNTFQDLGQLLSDTELTISRTLEVRLKSAEPVLKTSPELIGCVGAIVDEKIAAPVDEVLALPVDKDLLSCGTAGRLKGTSGVDEDLLTRGPAGHLKGTPGDIDCILISSNGSTGNLAQEMCKMKSEGVELLQQ